MTNLPAMTASFAGHSLPEPLVMLEAELQKGLTCYWNSAKTILDGSTVQLIEPETITFSLQRNFFSALFMYSYYKTGIAEDRRILYAAVNQCLRGMVTGCDNILDNEYKKHLKLICLPRLISFALSLIFWFQIESFFTSCSIIVRSRTCPWKN